MACFPGPQSRRRVTPLSVDTQKGVVTRQAGRCSYESSIPASPFHVPPHQGRGSPEQGGRTETKLLNIREFRVFNCFPSPAELEPEWNNLDRSSVVDNERYLGRQIWGQQSVEHEPGTGRRIMRDNPRDQWHVVDRPDLHFVSDELWNRAQTTRAEIRAAVAAKGEPLARGKSGKHHSKHLFSGFAKCGVCGHAIASVSGGKGSPRFGCRRSWQEGHACPNRLTIRIKVAEPQILGKLQEELLKAATVDYITIAVEKELKKAFSTAPKDVGALRKQLDQEKRKLQNFVSALLQRDITRAFNMPSVMAADWTSAFSLTGETWVDAVLRPDRPAGRCISERHYRAKPEHSKAELCARDNVGVGQFDSMRTCRTAAIECLSCGAVSGASRFPAIDTQSGLR